MKKISIFLLLTSLTIAGAQACTAPPSIFDIVYDACRSNKSITLASLAAMALVTGGIYAWLQYDVTPDTYEHPIRRIARNLGYDPYFASGYIFVSTALTNRAPANYNTYKIHLMPQDYSLGTIRDILKICNGLNLNKNITIKFYHIEGNNRPCFNGEILPCVVLYANGKEQAQQLLDDLYPLLSHIPGSNIQPRYNGRVTDLIWVAQGNGDDKKYRHEEEHPTYGLYEEPEAIYFKAGYPDAQHPRDHYLRHPETGAAITSGMQIFEN